MNVLVCALEHKLGKYMDSGTVKNSGHQMITF